MGVNFVRSRSLRPDLSDWSIFPKDVIHLLGSDLVGKVPDVEDPVHLGRQTDLQRQRPLGPSTQGTMSMSL